MPDPTSHSPATANECIVPFAACAAEAAQAQLGELQLPHLEQLLNRLQPETPDSGEEDSFSAPHERALARALGLPVEDGCIPWAALAAAERRPESARQAWAWISPCHWQVSTSQVTLGLPQGLDEVESRALLEVVQTFFTEDGLSLHYHSPGHWLACGEAFAGLRTASLDRVAGRDLEAWLPKTPEMRQLRRLQSETQMLLYTHPLTEQRNAQGRPPVNAFWISGCGRLPEGWRPPATAPHVLSTLREPALQENWPAWRQAWQTLDSGPLAELLQRSQAGQPLRLTLCGERRTQSFGPGRRGALQRIAAHWRPLSPASVLRSL